MTVAPLAGLRETGFRCPQPSRPAASPGSTCGMPRRAARQAPAVAATSPMRRAEERPPPGPHAIPVMGIGARVEAVVLDEQAGAGSLRRHGERDDRVQAAHALLSGGPGDPQHLSLIEGEHLAVPGAAQAALPDGIAVDREPMSGLQLEIIRHQPAADQIRVGERPPHPLLPAGKKLFHPEHLPPGHLVTGHGLPVVMTSPSLEPPPPRISRQGHRTPSRRLRRHAARSAAVRTGAGWPQPTILTRHYLRSATLTNLIADSEWRRNCVGGMLRTHWWASYVHLDPLGSTSTSSHPSQCSPLNKSLHDLIMK